MELNVLERIMALGIMIAYKEGNFATFKIIAGLKDKLPLTEEEGKEFEFREENKRYLWNEKGDASKEIPLTEGEKKLITDELVKLDKENKLTANQFTLYEKFVQL